MNRKKYFKYLSDALIFLLMGYVAFTRYPDIQRHFQNEGTLAPAFQVPLLSGERYDSSSNQTAKVLVFWATWCGPCTLELSRINGLIVSGEISADSVLAISSEGDSNLLAKTVLERGYRFLVGNDQDGRVAQAFGVSATPTIAFLEPDGKIRWLSSGISPFLSYRIKSFLKDFSAHSAL